MAQQLVDVLNKQIANWSVLDVKLHNYHWYVKGPHFFTLHAKFEELYNEAGEHIDELAERVLALGGNPVASMKEYLAIASIQEAKANLTAEQMVQSVIDDFKLLVAELKEGMAVAEKAGDETTHDMLLGISSGLQKHIWMLQSFLG